MPAFTAIHPSAVAFLLPETWGSERAADAVRADQRLRAMSIETIKRKECGSSDVVELKSGSFVCQHCEAVFKQSTRSGSPELCQVCEGGAVVSVGRCGCCRRPACSHHLVAYADIGRNEYGHEAAFAM